MNEYLTAIVTVNGVFTSGERYECISITPRGILMSVKCDTGATEYMTVEHAKTLFDEKDLFAALLRGSPQEERQ